MKATAGAFAHGLGGKMEIPLGPCAAFCIYHLVNLEEGEERLALPLSRAVEPDKTTTGLYRQEIRVIGKGAPPTPPLMASVPNPSPFLTPQTKTKPLEPVRTITIPHDDEPTPDPRPLTLGALASVLRSKNAGPYEITFDILFRTQAEYALVKSEPNFLTAALVARLYGLDDEEYVVWAGFFDQARAWKATIPRLFKGEVKPNGGFMEGDVHGSQRYAPLSEVLLPVGLVEKVAALRDACGREGRVV